MRLLLLTKLYIYLYVHIWLGNIHSRLVRLYILIVFMQGLLVKRNVQRKNVLQVLKYDTVLNLSSQNEMIQEKKI